MPFSRFCTQLSMSGLLLLSLSDLAEAQIVRRFAGGGVQVNAPFVQVNVGPGGGTSVRAPFTAVNVPGRTYVGRRRRWMAQPRYAAPQQNVAQRRQLVAKSSAKQPTPVDVDALPYPSASQLAAMDDATLVETLRKTMGRFNYRLSLLKTGAGWQKFLVLTREDLGPPGSRPQAARLETIQKVLPHYSSVQNDPQFAKISTLPSFTAAYVALQEAQRRLSKLQPMSGPEITDPNRGKPTPTESPVEEPLEILPTPQPAELPNATRGERSILKRK